MTFKINSSDILIAGGEDDGEDLQDCYSFDTINNTLKKVNDLPQSDSFKSPSTMILHNGLCVLGDKD